MPLTAEQTGHASLIVREGGETILEIRDLRLCAARFRPGGRSLVDEHVGLPLYWEQYANHQDPERNAGAQGTLRVTSRAADSLGVECVGKNRSGSVVSTYALTVRRDPARPAYVVDVQAAMRVTEESAWHVTPNPSHGEVEFCNLWPAGAFDAREGTPVLYDGCYVIRAGGITRIPHHHLESSDKHRIELRPGDALAWLLEEENPVVTILSGDVVSAGVCAYMWDAHLAYAVCHDGLDRWLTAGTEFRAGFRISSLSREEARAIAAEAVETPSFESEQTPVISLPLATFDRTLATAKEDPADLWPWETEVSSGDAAAVRFVRDATEGVDDRASVRIDAARPCRALWKATAIGPAFRQGPLAEASYRLVAWIKTRLEAGHASIGLRIHRTGAPDLFDPARYDLYASPQTVAGRSDWTRVELVTPPITPAPDRMHILLQLDGAGNCWFDHVELTSLP